MQLRALSEENCNGIHEATLKALDQTGVWFKDCPEAHALFADDGCKVDKGACCSRLALSRTPWQLCPTAMRALADCALE